MCRPPRLRKVRPESGLRRTPSKRPPIVPSPGRKEVFEKIAQTRDQMEAKAAAKAAKGDAAPACPPPPRPLFNKVVRIEGETTYSYWFVLTYLPDLQWCHVAPLEARGTFGAKAGASADRPKWMLVSEDEGGEIDVSAARCHVVEALEMTTNSVDADLEEWDIRD